MKWVTLILQLLSKIGDILKRRQREREQNQHEEQKQQAQNDPAGWFDDHFNGGMHGTGSGDGNAVPDDASETGKAKPDESDENR